MICKKYIGGGWKVKIGKFLKMFFNKYAWVGLILILISLMMSNFKLGTIFNLVTALLQTVGIALIVGAIFDFSRNTEAFVNFIAKILENIVVTKAFLTKLSEDDKRMALELILQPTNNQVEQYSHINEYFKKHIKKAMNLFNTNFKSNFSLLVNMQKEDGIVVARGRMSYRIYKINDAYEDIKLTFENKSSEQLGKRIITPNGTVKEITEKDSSLMLLTYENEAGIEYKVYTLKIPDEYNSYPYLTIQSEILEKGYDHWQNFHWTSFTPYDGLDFTLFCDKNLIVKEFVVYDEKSSYIVKLSEDKRELNICSTQWLDAYTGFSLTVGELERGK